MESSPEARLTRYDVLREREAQLRAILDTAVDGIITIDERGTIELFNPAAERIFGYAADEAIGQNVKLLMDSPHREAHDGYLARYLKTGRASIIGTGRQVPGRRKDGTTVSIDLAVSEVKSGKRRLFTALVRDLTDRERAEAAITSVSEFERQQIGRELHDGIGQEITGLTLLAKALANKMQDNPQLRKEANGIAALASKLLKDVKRQAHGLYPVELERNGLSYALRELAINQEALFRIKCAYEELSPPPAMSKSSELYLYRIAQEAVTNAIRHGQARRVLIRLERRESTVSLSIRDDGSGMPDKIPDKRGMGLTIMRYRANAVGGVLRISRNPDYGTTVTCAFAVPTGSMDDSRKD